MKEMIQNRENSAGKSGSALMNPWVLMAAASLSLAACGQSPSRFVQEVTPLCMEYASADTTPAQCECVVTRLDRELPAQIKEAFVALRWPLRPDDRERDSVNGQIFRAAGIDPADRQQMDSIHREFEDVFRPLNDEIYDQCGTSL